MMCYVRVGISQRKTKYLATPTKLDLGTPRGSCQNFQIWFGIRVPPSFFYIGVLPGVKKIVGKVCSNPFEHVQLPKLNE